MLAAFFEGFFTLLIWALIADAVDYQAYLTKQRNDGVVYSTVTFVVFMVASLATSFVAIVIHQLGYDPVLQAAQPPEVANRIRIAAGAMPAIGCLIVAFLFLVVYNMNDKKLAEVRAVIDSLSDKLEHEIDEDHRMPPDPPVQGSTTDSLEGDNRETVHYAGDNREINQSGIINYQQKRGRSDSSFEDPTNEI